MALARLPSRLPLALAAWIAWAALASHAAAEPKVDAESQKVLDTFGKFFQGTKGFRVKANIALEIEQKGQKQSQDFLQNYAAQRPNQFAYSLDSPGGGATVVSDGKQLSVFFTGFNKYAVEDAPATWAEMFQNPILLGSISFGNAPTVVIATLSEDPGKKLVEKATSVESGGIVELGETKCHLLKVTAEEMDYQIWIDAGKQPLVRKFLPDLTKTFERMAKAQGAKSPFADVKVTNTVTYKDWEIDPKFGEDAFVFKAPEGAEKVGSFMEIVTGGRRPAEPELHALVGKPAPEIKLDLLDGGKLDLAGLKDKVVILDFWATWCGPCVQAMPIIEKVAEKYKDKGVVLYAVNLQEKPDEIKAFLEEAKLKLAVALDTDGATAGAYKADAIPQTVLVGKDGSVQVVHVGLSANLEEELDKEIQALLEGKNLAADSLAAAAKKKEAAQKAEKGEAPPEKTESDK